MAEDARVEQLLEEIAALRDRVETLESKLEAGAVASMKGGGRCPACRGRRFLHAKLISDRDGQSMAGSPMAITHQGIFFRTSIGRFESYVCTGCGLVEWHVPDADAVKPSTSEHIEIVEVDEPPSGPFR